MTTRESHLLDDLAALAEEDRERLGEAPTTEQLIAYRDGRLGDDEADRIRDRLAVDPELAALYLDLKRFPDLAATADEAGSTADGEDAWQKLSKRLDLDPQIAEGVEPENQILAFPRRRPQPALLALAATLVLAVGLGWFLLVHREPLPGGTEPLLGSTEPLPDGTYHEVFIDGTRFRDSTLSVPNQATGLAIRLDVASLERPGSYIVEFLDASGQRIRRQQVDLVADQQTLVSQVASSSLEDGRSYRITVRRASDLNKDPPVLEVGFTVKLGDFEIFEYGPVACAGLDADLDEATRHRRRGDRGQARALYMRILDQAIEGLCLYQEARARNGLGGLAILEGSLLESLRIFDLDLAALRAARSASPDDPELAEKADRLEATIEINRSNALYRLNWLDDAADALGRVRSRYGRFDAGPEKWALVLLQESRIHRLQEEPEKAKAVAREALGKLGDEEPKIRATLWQQLAWIDIEQGRYDDAERALEQALEALVMNPDEIDEINRANLLADRAELAALRERWPQCLADAQEALSVRAAAGTPDLHLETHARYLQSLALWEMGDAEAALRASESGLALFEALHTGWQELGIQFFARRQRFYRHRLDIAAALEDPAEAWSVFESYRARGLRESAGLRQRGSGSPESAAWQEWERRVDELAETVAALDRWDPSNGDAERQRLETLFRNRRLALRQLRAEIFPVWGPPDTQDSNFEAVREVLDRETLALTFAQGQRKLHVFALDRLHGLELYSLGGNAGKLDALVGKLLQRLDPHASSSARAGLDADAKALSEQLLSPLGDRLDGVRRLAVAVDTPLERLPFEVLPHPRTGRPLIETHEIVYLPSFSFLAASDARLDGCRRPEKSLLAVGDPIFGSADSRWPAGVPGPRNADDRLVWEPLPDSADEVTAAARFYSSPTTALGTEATQQIFLTEAPKHRVIHVASHARSDSETPERSRVALSCLDERGRVLEKCDLYFVDAVSLELCGQVVVLSACGSAAGRSVDGEGVLGLPWAFLRAGAATVVASLWPVADEPTAELMTVFHSHLSQGKGPADALRQAKLERFRAGAPPSDWAPFVALGDWQIDRSSQ